jgi:hypothetical protein
VQKHGGKTKKDWKGSINSRSKNFKTHSNPSKQLATAAAIP